MNDTPIPPLPRSAWIAFAAMATLLLAGTLAWHVPMMLWDHLDLLPILEAALAGQWSASVLAMHDGSHMHAAAYAALLLTTTLSGGQTWLDCLLSWALLMVTAAIVMAMARRWLPAMTPRWQVVLLVFLALYPGHLANLQWGWQVAVFLCLLGSIGAIALLTSAQPSWRNNVLAMAGGVLAWLSFATSLALVPAAIVLIALRADLSSRRKLTLSLPWLVLGMLALWQITAVPNATSTAVSLQPLPLLHYTLNLIGAGALRFATDLAPWLAVFAIVTAILAVMLTPRELRASAWLGLLLFGLFAALLTAAGRVGPFGVDHAFAQRYISFSSLFWLGWTGLMIVASVHAPRWHRHQRAVVAIVAVLLVANALHLIKKAATTGERSRETAAEIATTWPNVDERVLREIYFDRITETRERLALLRRYCFAPFGHAAANSCERFLPATQATASPASGESDTTPRH